MSNILQRTLFLRVQDETATGFTIDVDGRHYLITAKHFVQNEGAARALLIFRSGSWVAAPMSLVGVSKDDPEDLAVLAPSIQLTPLLDLAIDKRSYFLSQDIYFLGFPYGLASFVPPEINNGFPIPLVKKGIISDIGSSARGHRIILLDGHNNFGFSGGPVVFSISDRPQVQGLCSVISGFRYAPEEIVTKAGAATDYVLKANTGIVATTAIEVGLEIIRENPIGFKLPS